MRILVAGATGSIGIHVVNTAIAMGHQPVTLVRNRRKIKLLPRGTDIFYGDVSIPETLTDLPKDIDAIIFTLGSDGQGRIGARAIDYGGVRNILRIFMDTPVRIALMTTIGVTERLSSWNQRTEVHDWKRRSEQLSKKMARVDCSRMISAFGHVVARIVHEELCCIILQFMIQRELQQFGVSFTRQILIIANVYSHINY